MTVPITDSIDEILAATSPKSLLGTVPAEIDANHRRLAKECHPDRFVKAAPSVRKRAETAFKLLQDLYAQAIGKPSLTSPVRVGDYVVTGSLTRGDVCDLYHVESTKDDSTGILKLARSSRDNDLMQAEFENLTFLLDSAAGSAWSGLDKHETFQHYLLKLLTTVKANGRQGNILSDANEFIPLNEFNSIWKHGIDYRHFVWMCNRALSIIGYAQYRGVVHGAVLPEHLLYNPVSHDLRLVDWCYSVRSASNKHIPAIVSARKELYPQEVTRKLPASAMTDLCMLVRSLETVRIAGERPEAFKHLLTWAKADSTSSRPQNIWEFQDRWVAAAKVAYGPAKFTVLEIPK